MFKRTINPTLPSDRLAYLWLAIAAALLLFAAGRWAVPLAAWLAPVFLLRFVRTQRVLTGLLLAWLVRSAVSEVVSQGTILYPGILPYVLVIFVSLVLTLAFLADRLMTPGLTALRRRWSFHWPSPRLSTSALLAPSGAIIPRLTRSMATCRSCSWHR